MPLITWSDNLSVGIDSIDAQHKSIITMINTLNDALADGSTHEVLHKIFDGLAVYTITHFDYEEKLFAEYDYVDNAAHTAEHQALRRLTNTANGPV